MAKCACPDLDSFTDIRCLKCFPRVSVRRSKYSRNHRPDGHRNWQVIDHLYGRRLVFSSHRRAVVEAHRLAYSGFINPIGLVGCYLAAENTCRFCSSGINFIRACGDHWDWVSELGGSLCSSTDSRSGRHYPVNPVEGIDF